MFDTFGMGSEERDDEHALGPVSLAYLRNSIALIENSGINDKIMEWDDGARTSMAGRKRVLPLTATLPIMLLHIQMGRGVVYLDIANTLHRGFGAKHFEMLGIPNQPSDKMDWYHRFWHGLKRVINHIDPYPFPLDGRMKAGEYAERLKAITQGESKDEHERNIERIDWLCNQLVLASARTMPKEFLRQYQGNCAIDASLIAVQGRQNPTNPELNRSNPDPFSGRYRRGGKHDGKGAKTDVAGYEVETATTVWSRPSESELFPSVVTAISFHKPGQLVGHGMKLIERHKAAFDLDRFLVMADRAYNHSRVETFHIPARKAGVELVIDYRSKDLGLQGAYADLYLVDGNWHVRSMPHKLTDATKDLVELEKSRSEFERAVYNQKRATLLARLKNRSAYRVIAKGLPDLDGYQRFTYPTESPVPLAPLDGKKSIVIPLLIPERTFEAKEPGGKSRVLQPLKHLQRFAYMSEEWASYYGMRNLVEASNSRFKDANQEDLGNTKKRSGRGFSSNYLVTALAISSFNLRSIAAFILKLRDKAVEKPIRARRRKDENKRPLARLVTAQAAAPPG
ncbi:hypothetical protein [Salinibacterium sp. M195]|uniref:hypothetical protein n=1 Tax=Salinibacterium sp. M195 TaxID=2583374 RepID=UPI001C62AC9B|nr:hypothetical protein [Salinibacterium sp. M195]QYH34591.1 hypothetical protein FFT87_00700 [Salinibacterium sp. M195]